MTNEYRKTLSDVDLILNELTEDEVNKIPKKLRKFISDNKLKEYKSSIITDKPIEDQELTSSTQAFLAMLYLNYWCENEDEKKELTDILSKNEKEYKRLIDEKYSTDNLFKKKTKEENNDENIPEEKIIETTEIQSTDSSESLFKKIISKIFKLFKRS